MRLTAKRWCGVWLWAVALHGACGWGAAGQAPAGGAAAAATNVIVVTMDGMRWQEVFGGFEPMLATDVSGGVRDSMPLRAAFARDSAEESRAAILPFFWEVVAKKGQVFGDRGVKNVGHVTNPYRFSYPGYSEMLCGFVDPRVNSNDYAVNPNVTVLEWLNGRPGFEGRVAAYGAWNRLTRIVNVGRSKLPTVAGWEPIEASGGVPLSEREKVLNDLLARTTRLWVDEMPDSILQEAAMEYFTSRGCFT